MSVQQGAERTVPCPAFWTSDGRCSDDDSGAGRHKCSHVDTYSMREQQVHPECECRCGAKHARPLGALRLARNRQAVVEINPSGTGSVLVGGMELASCVTSCTVEANGMRPTRVRLGMEHVHVAAAGEAVLDDLTHNALLQLGWVPPETDALHREELRTAMRCEYDDWRRLTELAGDLRRDVDLEYGS